MRIAAIMLTLMLFSSSVYASCYTNAWGHVVCNNGTTAGGYNANTGTAWKSQRGHSMELPTHRPVGEDKP